MHRHSVGNICPDDNHSIVRLFTTWLAASRERLLPGSTATTPSAPSPKRKAVSVESPPQVSALPPTWFIGFRRARLWPLSASRPRSTDLLPPSALPRSLRSLRLFPPARPAAGRLPAGAGHLAAVVVLRIHRDNSADSWGLHQSERQRVLGYLTSIRVTLLYIKTTERSISI